MFGLRARKAHPDGRDDGKRSSVGAAPASGLPTVVDYAEAARFATCRIVVAPSAEKRQIRPLLWLPSVVYERLCLTIGHIELAAFARCHTDADLIIVASFRTRVLAAVWPILWLFRSKLLFIVHHNVQFAHQRLTARSLKALCRVGFRFGLLEGMDGLAELGIDPNPRQFLVLPNPVHNATRPAIAVPDQPRASCIGVIGHYGRQKNIDQLLAILLDARDEGKLYSRIILGCDDDRVLSEWSGRRITTINTKCYMDYLGALAQCDVVVLNYARDQYYYRSSGVISDAAGLGVAVACPDFPILRKQVTEPVSVGAVFRSQEEISSAVDKSIALRRRAPQNFAIWSQARHPKEFSRRLDEFVALQR
jgi:hypothetical protein